MGSRKRRGSMSTLAHVQEEARSTGSPKVNLGKD